MTFKIGDEEYAEEINTSYDQEQDIGDEPNAYFGFSEPVNAKNGQTNSRLEEVLSERATKYLQHPDEYVKYCHICKKETVHMDTHGDEDYDYCLEHEDGEETQRRKCPANIQGSNGYCFGTGYCIGCGQNFANEEFTEEDQEWMDNFVRNEEEREEKERFMDKMRREESEESVPTNPIELKAYYYIESSERPETASDLERWGNNIGVPKEIMFKVFHDYFGDRFDDGEQHSFESLNKDGTGVKRATRGLDPKNTTAMVLQFVYVSKSECETCKQYDGMVFSIDSPNRPIIPRLESQGKKGTRPYTHPNCKCKWVRVFSDAGIKNFEDTPREHPNVHAMEAVNPKIIARAKKWYGDDFDKLSSIQQKLEIINMYKEILGMESMTIDRNKIYNWMEREIDPNNTGDLNSGYGFSVMQRASDKFGITLDQAERIWDSAGAEEGRFDNDDDEDEEIYAENGDLVDFGAYGKLYVIDNDYMMSNGRTWWVSDKKDDDSGWSISASQAKRIINESIASERNYSNTPWTCTHDDMDDPSGYGDYECKLCGLSQSGINMYSEMKEDALNNKLKPFENYSKWSYEVEKTGYDYIKNQYASESYMKHKCPQCHLEFNTNDEVITHMLEVGHGENFEDIEDSPHNESFANEGWKEFGRFTFNANEGGKGSGKVGHVPWMLGTEMEEICQKCMINTERDNGKCILCGT